MQMNMQKPLVGKGGGEDFVPPGSAASAIGAPSGDRTQDLRIKSPLLYRLS